MSPWRIAALRSPRTPALPDRAGSAIAEIGIGTADCPGVPVREPRPDLGFDRVGVDVADHDHLRALRPVIGAIEIGELGDRARSGARRPCRSACGRPRAGPSAGSRYARHRRAFRGRRAGASSDSTGPRSAWNASGLNVISLAISRVIIRPVSMVCSSIFGRSN